MLKYTIVAGDSREILKSYENCADLIVTSPPYADARKKHYESVAPDQYADWFYTFHEVFFNTLKPSGSLVINIKDKVINGVRDRYVWKTIEKLTGAGWYCIDDYIWHKTNPMPGYWPTRLQDGWEYCFHLAKTKKPYFNRESIKQPIGEWAKKRLNNLSESDKKRHGSENGSGFGRAISNWAGKKTVSPSNVIKIPVISKNTQHPCAYPVALPGFFIKLLSPHNGLVVDPFSGSGSTGVAALLDGRNCLLIDKLEDYCMVADKRLREIKHGTPQ